MLLASYDSYDSGAATGAVVGMIFLGLLYLAAIAFGVYLYMRVARKAGWTLWHGLLVLVPVANLVFLIMFAFTEWPIERRVRELEARAGLAPGGSDPYAYGAAGYGAAAPVTGYGAPAYGAPTPAAPAYGAPAGAAPAYGVPVQDAPAYGAPAYGTPAGEQQSAAPSPEIPSAPGAAEAQPPANPWDPPAAPR